MSQEKSLTELLDEKKNQAWELDAQITEYLCVGGLFNPEMMEHEKVRDLLMSLRTFVNNEFLRSVKALRYAMDALSILHGDHGEEPKIEFAAIAQILREPADTKKDSGKPGGVELEHEHKFDSDGGQCRICYKTVAQIITEKSDLYAAKYVQDGNAAPEHTGEDL